MKTSHITYECSIHRGLIAQKVFGSLIYKIKIGFILQYRQLLFLILFQIYFYQVVLYLCINYDCLFFFFGSLISKSSPCCIYLPDKNVTENFTASNNSKLSGTRSNSADETAIILFPLIYCVTKEMRYGARCLYTCLLYFSSIAKKYMIDVSKEKHLEVMRQFPTLF